MNYPTRKQQLEHAAEQFCLFLKSPEKARFSGYLLEKLSEEEKIYIHQFIHNQLGVPFDATKWLSESYSQPNHINLAMYLAESQTFMPDINVISGKETLFTMLVNYYFNVKDKNDFMNSLIRIYEHGYQSKPADLEFLKFSYDRLKNDYQCLIWSVGRFAYKLNAAELIKKAVEYHMPLLTIACFKMRRPFGINYHNLLGVANNALQHYRSHIELLIHAMNVYDVNYDIEKRDHKGTFKQRLEDYYENQPPQDPDIAEIAYILFPELRE